MNYDSPFFLTTISLRKSMRSIFVFVALTPWGFAAALPRISDLSEFPRNATLQRRQGQDCTCTSGYSCCQGINCANSLPSQSSSVPPPSSSVSSTSSSPSQAAPTSPATPIPVIVGASVGGATGLAGLSYLAWLYSGYLLFFLASVAFSIFLPQLFVIFGWWLFTRRRLVVFCHRDVPETSIAFFLSTHQKIENSLADETLLVWGRKTVGRSTSDSQNVGRGVYISCPMDPIDKPTPQTMIGFGTVKDKATHLVHHYFAPAPALWQGEEFADSQEGTRHTTRDLTFTNETDQHMPILVGTVGHAEDFRPFFYVDSVGPQQKYPLSSKDLYLHAFRTHHTEGITGSHFIGFLKNLMEQHHIECDNLEQREEISQKDVEPTQNEPERQNLSQAPTTEPVKQESEQRSIELTSEQRQALKAENLTSKGGIRLSSLKPISLWVVERDEKNGDQLQLKLVRGGLKEPQVSEIP
ncbi:hypothetical protein DL96DRAFT_1781568 [Flagelloscypha sp. PMI_526]|nr:hypothetical protein DL96DRAFT_1781568 [Flagelloscypha sp. PMI_526]